MNVIETRLKGVVIIEPVVFGDHRGFFLESYNQNSYRAAGIQENFVQDNHSRSGKDVLRGLHFQRKKPQGKLVRVTEGEVFDVAVDINPHSETFTQWVGITLSANNHRQFYVPPGYAHGFVVISETADFQYKCTEFYDPADEGGILWNDSRLAIDWPVINPKLSDKDRNLPTIEQALDQLTTSI